MPKTGRPLFVALILAGGVAATSLPACDSGPAEEAAPVQQVRQHSHGSPVMAVVDTALERASLDESQQAAVQEITARFRDLHDTRDAFREEMRASIGSIVRSGTTDSAEFDAMVEKAAKAIEERVAVGAEAVEEIHGLLRADQRAAVAEGLRERIDERWGKARRERHEAFEEIAEELVLSDEQVAALEKVRDQLRGHGKELRPSAEELYDLVDAFETETFAETLDAFHAEKAPLLREKIATASSHADVALGILDADQRDVLAEIIEQGREVLAERQ